MNSKEEILVMIIKHANKINEMNYGENSNKRERRKVVFSSSAGTQPTQRAGPRTRPHAPAAHAPSPQRRLPSWFAILLPGPPFLLPRASRRPAQPGSYRQFLPPRTPPPRPLALLFLFLFSSLLLLSAGSPPYSTVSWCAPGGSQGANRGAGRWRSAKKVCWRYAPPPTPPARRATLAGWLESSPCLPLARPTLAKIPAHIPG